MLLWNSSTSPSYYQIPPIPSTPIQTAAVRQKGWQEFWLHGIENCSHWHYFGQLKIKKGLFLQLETTKQLKGFCNAAFSLPFLPLKQYQHSLSQRLPTCCCLRTWTSYYSKAKLPEQRPGSHPVCLTSLIYIKIVAYLSYQLTFIFISPYYKQFTLYYSKASCHFTVQIHHLQFHCDFTTYLLLKWFFVLPYSPK